MKLSIGGDLIKVLTKERKQVILEDNKQQPKGFFTTWQPGKVFFINGLLVIYKAM